MRRRPLLLAMTTLVVLLAAIYLHRGGVDQRDSTNLGGGGGGAHESDSTTNLGGGGGGVHERDTKFYAKQRRYDYNNGNFPTKAIIDAFALLIAQLRDRLESGVFVHGIAVLVRPGSVPLVDRFIEIQLENGDAGDVIIAIFDTVNIYFVGFTETRTRGSLLPTLHYLNDTGVERELFLAYPSPAYAHHNLGFGGNYNNLGNRENIEIGHDALNNAIRNLYHGGSERNAVLVIIQMLPEAVRMRYVESRIRISMQNNQNIIPNPKQLSLENRYSDLCEQVQWTSDNRPFPTPIQIRNVYNNPIEITDVISLIQQVGIVLLLYVAPCNPRNPNMGTPPVVAFGADNDKPCPDGEPATNIIGTDGQCMDVYNSQYNNGDTVIIWKCGNAQRNQLWTFKSDGTIRSNGKCLTTYGYTSGSYIMIFDCDKAAPEATKWFLTDVGTIMNPKSGLVIAAIESSTEGTVLGVAEDNNSSRQAWSVGIYTQPTISYISGLQDMCLQANGVNARVRLAFCVSEPTQQWALYGDKTIRLFSDRTLCVTSDGNESESGIILLKCQGSGNQRWTFMADSTILNPDARLVMDVWNSDVSRQEINLFQPTGNANQKWIAF